MGIKGLTSLLNDEAPGAIKQLDIKTLFGRKVAIDASTSLYQFLIAVRQADGQQMMSESGEVTSHLLGFFYRTLRMVDYGIKPMYVFDGKPPDLKKDVLVKRFGKREEAREQEEEVKDIADTQVLDQLARRQVRPTREHNAEVQKLLTLMGIPWVIAPSEAEAQCAELARSGKVYAAGSEDMDTLTFGAPILLRNLTASEQKKLPVTEITLAKALEEMGMPMDKFVDLCLLLGCDYLDPIRGVGPKKALKLVEEFGSLDKILAHLEQVEKEKELKKKATEPRQEQRGSGDESDAETAPKKRAGGIQVPELWPYEEARQLFHRPDVLEGAKIEVRTLTISH
ncbi:Elongation of fatty acids protein 2 [Malassezia vespertilionis]|uniref:Elongation of fatty acids protein 2 n=1 Tax=Malassezia vespertilionis TaxID=2020962 RepID=UPI0024B16762|nr:Elongation of fatty acids protein 2 [Malassezia vespertilionis]WFD05789.1 Elongation of fatty acids protein 2 [Malassezia vespertilionis]